MSSTESSGAPAEGSATPPAANSAAASTFGSSRGSGLLRGKRPSVGQAASSNAPASDYKPTAIEVVNAPREYQNPFAPAPSESAPTVSEAPISAAPPAAAAPTAPAERVSPPAPTSDVTANDLGTTSAPPPARPVRPARGPSAPGTSKEGDLFPLDPAAPHPSHAQEKAELNILPPERPKSVAPQTWESEGFRPPQREGREPREAREPRENRDGPRPERGERPDRPRRDDRFGGERREREGGHRPSFEQREPRDHQRRPDRPEHRRDDAPRPSATPAAASAPAKSGGFLGWLKSLFGGATETTPVETPAREGGHGHRPGGRDGGHGHRSHRGGGGRGGQRHYRGGHGQGQGGEHGGDRGGPEGSASGGEHRGGEHDGFRRRRRGGRGRGQFRGDRGGEHRGGGENHPQA